MPLQIENTYMVIEDVKANNEELNAFPHARAQNNLLFCTNYTCFSKIFRTFAPK